MTQEEIKRIDRMIKKEWQALKSRDLDKLRYIFGEAVGGGELKELEDLMGIWIPWNTGFGEAEVIIGNDKGNDWKTHHMLIKIENVSEIHR